MTKSRNLYATRGSALEVRLRFNTVESDGCWEWTAYRNALGYGVIRYAKKTWLAHRLSYTARVGAIPTGILVCHRCDNPACIRPDHLVLGTDLDNNRDMQWRGRANKSRGVGHLGSKLTEDEVRAIRAENPIYGYAIALAEQYKVSVSAIQKIRQQKTWRHLL